MSTTDTQDASVGPGTGGRPRLLAELRSGIALRRGLVADGDRRIYGATGAALWILASLATIPAEFSDWPAHQHKQVLWILIAIAFAIGVAHATVIDWERAPALFFVGSSLVAVALLGWAVWCTGGEQSLIWPYLLTPVVFAAWFYPARPAGAILLLVVLVNAAPILYDHAAGDYESWLRWSFGGMTFCLVSGAVILGRALMWLHRDRESGLIAQEHAMRAVAAAVLAGAGADEIYQIAARQMANVNEGAVTAILRVESDGIATLLAAWPPDQTGVHVPGITFEITADSKIPEALQSRRPVRSDELVRSRFGARYGFNFGLVAPILVPDDQRYVMLLAADRPVGMITGDHERLMVLGDLIAAAIRSVHDREQLARRASSDALTGLSNTRTFDAALKLGISSALTRGKPLALAVIDLDSFKQINDSAGHDFGDQMLNRLADAMRAHRAERDTVGRVGGDEFAWLMPDATAAEAFDRVEAARAVFQATDDRHLVTISVGICDTRLATDPVELRRLADGALYWSKANGRAQTRIYDAAEIGDLSERERAARLAHSQTLVGLRALARAIDAKDPVTSQHSDRVADLTAQLARVRGWPEERISRLRDAALVHDVGKLAIPDSLLTKWDELTQRETLQMHEHVGLSVQIAAGVLDDEQLTWIRTHHERPDGLGYPAGLTEPEIPEGGTLLAVANAFDAMVAGRNRHRHRDAAGALAECRALAGQQFTVIAVGALEQVLDEHEHLETAKATVNASAGIER